MMWISDDRVVEGTPILAVCGWSGSGKTWLLERLIPRLKARGLWVAVLKHDAHRLELDREGKDTDRLWKAGAQLVLAHDPEQVFLRSRKVSESDSAPWIATAGANADLLLVEGHKGARWPKIWLEHPEKKNLPPEVEGVIEELPWGAEDRLERAEAAVARWLEKAHSALRAGILVGGQSRRMGRPKSEIRWDGKTAVEHAISLAEKSQVAATVLGGGASVPSGTPLLADVEGAKGPLGGMLSAMRWAPGHAWWFVACDMPLLGVEAFEWLRAQRRAGAWVVLPRRGGRDEPLCAIYEPQARGVLEAALTSNRFALRKILDHPKVLRVEVPEALAGQWTNCNTAGEWREAGVSD